MNDCSKVLIGEPQSDVVTIGTPYCPEGGGARAELVAMVTEFISGLSGSDTDVELCAVIIEGNALFVVTQDDVRAYVFMGDEASLFYVGLEDGLLTGESGYRGGSEAAEDFIVTNNVEVTHPDAEFAETMQGYIQMMRGEQINVIDV